MRTDGGTATTVRNVLVDSLIHYGVKGQRWGQRTDHSGPVSVRQKGKKLKATGGKGEKPSSDAIKKATLAQKKKKSGIIALSDAELQAYSRRLQLEQSVKGLEYSQKPAIKKFVANLLGTAGKQAAQQAANEVASNQVKKIMHK